MLIPIKVKWLLFISPAFLLGVFILYFSVTSVPLDKSKMTSVVSEFDHYLSDSHIKYPIDELYLTNGSKYFIEVPENSAFQKESFLKNVKKGEKVELLVEEPTRITMLKSGSATYMSFQDAYNSDRENNKLGVVLGIFMLLLWSIAFVIIILQKV